MAQLQHRIHTSAAALLLHAISIAMLMASMYDTSDFNVAHVRLGYTSQWQTCSSLCLNQCTTCYTGLVLRLALL